jgi:hypothetical protein
MSQHQAAAGINLAALLQGAVATKLMHKRQGTVTSSAAAQQLTRHMWQQGLQQGCLAAAAHCQQQVLRLDALQ